MAMSGYRDWTEAGWREHLPEVADVSSFVAGLGADTIPALAAASAAAVPGRIAITVDGEPVTHAELDDAAARVAGWLARRVRPGDRVLFAAASSVGFVRCYLGALRAGAVIVLANPGYTSAELGHLAADSEAVLAFTDREPARLLAGLGSGSGRLPTVDVRELPEGAGRGAGIEVRPQDTALLAYTSGTTGRPKGVPLTHGQLAVGQRHALGPSRGARGVREQRGVLGADLDLGPARLVGQLPDVGRPHRQGSRAQAGQPPGRLRIGEGQDGP